MKKSMIASLVILMAVFSMLGIVSAANPCAPGITIINQDPYPAIPGDYVKVVFQIDGLENPNCGIITFGVKENYPIHLDPSTLNPITINSGTYRKDFSSFYLAPYKIRLDENALDGENPLEVYYTAGTGTLMVNKDFNITVQDTRANFEVYVKDYDFTTRILTFEILNTAKTNVKALTLEIPKQNGIEIKGANRVVVGDLDSNEYTTADFEAILPQGQTNINLSVLYTDSINARRTIQKTVSFDSSYFTNVNTKSKIPWFWIIVIILIIAFFVWRRIKKKNREKERMKKRGMM
jgi:hypothetical protein